MLPVRKAERFANSRGRVVVVLEQRFERTPDGRVWGPGTFGPAFWSRYLIVFATVTVVARLKHVATPSDGYHRCDSDVVDFAPVPDYLGPWEFLKNRRAVRRAAIAAYDPSCSVILRIPSPIGSCLVSHLHRIHQPYAVEVIGDPYDVMSPAAFRHPLRPIFRWWLTRRQRSECRAASAAAYVTERTLQGRYPCHGFSVGVSDVALALVPPRTTTVFTTHYSSVALSGCVAAPRALDPLPLARPVLISVATLSQMYKGIDVLIDAIHRCVSNGLDVHAIVAGDGKYRGDLQARAERRGVSDRVRFAGQLSRYELTDSLDAADVFVLASRCEGLPRAMIEAMARGLPCIGSEVGGIPELLSAEDMVPPGSSERLAATITEVVRDGWRRAQMSRRNLEKAQEYRDETLGLRRTAFYRQVRSVTEEWAAS